MTREDIIRMAREAGMAVTETDSRADYLTRFAALVAAHEREECARVCERIGDYDENVDEYYSDTYAAAIRSRQSI